MFIRETKSESVSAIGRKSRSAKTAWVDVAAGNGIDGSVALQAPYGRAVNMLEKQSLV